MNHKRPPIPAILVLALLLIISGYFIVTQTRGDDERALTASGTIESTVVNLSPEMAGKVKEVLVEEGQYIRMGDALLSLDESLLVAQREVAQSGVESAHNAVLMAQSAYGLALAQYDASLSAARAQQSAQRLTDWSNPTASFFEQPAWYFSRDEQIRAAQAEVEASQLALEQAEAEVEEVGRGLDSNDFVSVESHLSEARMSYQIARSVRDRAQPADLSTAAQDTFEVAEAELDEAEEAYKELLTTDEADRMLAARAALSVAQERYESALDTLSRLQTGEYSPQVKIAALALEQGESALAQAQTAVNQAEASLSLLDAQIAKLIVYAPMDGLVLTRNVEPGEFVQPGAAAFAIADLNNITITVFVPEDRYGQLSLGQQAEVSVDSFPGEVFAGEVVQIGSQAEFTPRNVQTVEGRSATVYAIKLRVTNTDGKLKIGMPADVIFK